MTQRKRQPKGEPGAVSVSGTHLMYEDGSWHDRTEVNWRDPSRITQLAAYLTKGMTAGEIAKAFGDVTRSGVIGAISRLNASGHMSERLTKTNQRVKDKPQATTKARLRTIASQRVKIDATKKEVVQRDHNGNVQTVEIVEWKEQPALKAYNLTRIPHAKPLIECTGCKWVVDDKAYLMCNDTVWRHGSAYCETHAAWAQPTSLDLSKRQTTPNKGYASFLSPWDTRNKR